MKSSTKVLILILVCLFVFLVGCTKKDYSQNQEQGFSNDTLKAANLEIDKQAAIAEFKDDLEQFKAFSDDFFPIWLEHISSTSSMLDDFNNSTILEEKYICSNMLEQRYSELKINLETIKPPAIAKKAYGLAFEAACYRALFFKKYNENAPVKELVELETKAYVGEVGFWNEIDNLYRYFDEEMAGLRTTDDNRYVVFK